jgi:DNA-binding transcriptional MerR regulator
VATSRRERATAEVAVEDVDSERPPEAGAPKDQPSRAARSEGSAPESSPFAPVVIPDRRYFRIGEVADLLGVRPHVLRYWETEFRELKPGKSRHGQRLYRRRDVETLVTIRRLLHGERYTIQGARERLREILRGEADPPGGPPAPDLGRLERLEAELVDLISLLDRRSDDLGD